MRWGESRRPLSPSGRQAGLIRGARRGISDRPRLHPHPVGSLKLAFRVHTMTAVSSLFLGAAAVAVMPAAGSAQQAPAPQYTAAQAETGQEVFEETCAACHKPDLTGGDQAPPLSGAYFASSWGGHPVAELLTFAKDNMPFTQPSSLDVETYVNVHGRPGRNRSLTFCRSTGSRPGTRPWPWVLPESSRS